MGLEQVEAPHQAPILHEGNSNTGLTHILHQVTWPKDEKEEIMKVTISLQIFLAPEFKSL